MKKYPCTLILCLTPELLTPAESRHTTCLLGEKSPSVKLMSRRENKVPAKINLKNMDKTMQKLQHIESIDALTLLRPGVAQKALFASRILKQLLPTRIKLTAKTVDEDPASCKHWISKKREI